MNTVIVASVQFEPLRANPQVNMQLALQHTFEAAVKGARIVVLPELCVSGADLTMKEAIQCSQIIEGYQTEMFMPLCRRYHLLVVFGYPELFEGEMHNSAVIVGGNGPVANARKKCLEGRDFRWAKPGDDSIPPVVIHEGIRVGALLSQDARNHQRDSAAWARFSGPFYRKGMVDLICIPSARQESLSFPDSQWVQLAEETCSNVVVSNLVFDDPHGRTGGGSCIIDRNLRVWSHGSSLTGPAVVGGLAL
jgi:predicted amidohydrolase